ncbi:MAG: homoserine dehydrogenase [Mycobacteriales bacterium]
MTVRLALLGCGTVGSQVVRLLAAHQDDFAARIGTPVELVGVACRRPHRHPEIDPALLTADAAGLVRRPDVDIVIELIGGIEPARTLLLEAIKTGKSVVTGNKALLAEDGAAMQSAARDAGVDLYYEASVAGAIPLLRPLRESLAGDRITRVLGIVNGTTNFILSRMHETGSGFGDALDEATSLGYAEADPTADIDGFDAASKAAILAGLAFHSTVTAADVYREGISEVTAADISSAAGMHCVVKLLAICERHTDAAGNETIGVRVHPAMIPRTHALAGVGGAFNAVYVEAAAAGQLMFYGPGAGGAPSASAVLGDVVAVARNRVAGTASGLGRTAYADLPVRSIGETRTRYHVSIDVADRPGVLAEVAQVFAAHEVSIQTMRQDGRGADASLVLVTHTAPDAALSETVDGLRRIEAVREVTSVMRVEGDNDTDGAGEERR